MANGKPSTEKSLIDEIVRLKKENVKGYGVARAQKSVRTNTSLGTSGAKGGSDKSNDLNTLKTQGDTMIGPIAFYPNVAFLASGVLDISDTSDGIFTGRAIVLGEGGVADDLVTISGVAFNGQLLFLQSVETTPITLKNGTGNIFIPTGADYIVVDKEIVILQYDSVNNTWTAVGNFTAATSGVQPGDSIVWTGTHTWTNSPINFNSAVVNIGDQVTDRLNVLGKVGTDLTPFTDDLHNLGSATKEWNDLFIDGIGHIDTLDIDGTISSLIPLTDNAFDLGTNTFEWRNLFIDGTAEIDALNSAGAVIGTLTVTSTTSLNGATTNIGDNTTDNLNILGRVRTDIHIDSGKFIKSFDSTEIGFQVTNAAIAVGGAGTIQIPFKTGNATTGAQASTDFGNATGCMGVYLSGGGSPLLVIREADGDWASLIMTSGTLT